MDKIIKVGTLIVKEDKALLIKEWSEAKQDFRWNIVKGTFEETNDKLLIDCAKREAKEEAGVKVSVDKFLGVFIKYGFNIRIYINFLASIKSGTPKIASNKEQKSRSEDIKEVLWFDKEKIKKLSKNDFVNDVAYETVNNWLKGKVYPLHLLNEIDLRS